MNRFSLNQAKSGFKSLVVVLLSVAFTSSGWATELAQLSKPLAMPLDLPTSQEASPANKLSKSQRKAVIRQQKRELADMEASPLMNEVLRLKWQAAPLHGPVDDLQKIGLDKVFRQTAASNLEVRQAQVQIKDAELQAKELVESNPLILLNPVLMNLLKQAGHASVDAAKSHADFVKQKALLESARMYSTLTQAYLAKYLAFQAIDQGRNQLKLEEQRFVSGETDRFGVTQTQIALIDRYNRYLVADDAYYAASLALSNQLDYPENKALIPDEVSLQSEVTMVPTLTLMPADLTLAKAQKAALTRPDIQEGQFRKEALQKLIKAANGQERRKREAELRQLDLQIEKGTDAVSATTSRAYAQYQTAKQSLELSLQRYELARQFVYQLEVSNKAGFSSTKDVLDGQLELAKANSALIEARLNCNLSQIALAYEMGMLKDDLVSHPLPPNAL